MDKLLSKYQQKLQNFEKTKDSLTSQLEGNSGALILANMYLMLLDEIVSDLNK